METVSVTVTTDRKLQEQFSSEDFDPRKYLKDSLRSNHQHTVKTTTTTRKLVVEDELDNDDNNTDDSRFGLLNVVDSVRQRLREINHTFRLEQELRMDGLLGDLHASYLKVETMKHDLNFMRDKIKSTSQKLDDFENTLLSLKRDLSSSSSSSTLSSKDTQSKKDPTMLGTGISLPQSAKWINESRIFLEVMIYEGRLRDATNLIIKTREQNSRMMQKDKNSMSFEQLSIATKSFEEVELMAQTRLIPSLHRALVMTTSGTSDSLIQVGKEGVDDKPAALLVMLGEVQGACESFLNGQLLLMEKEANQAVSNSILLSPFMCIRSASIVIFERITFAIENFPVSSSNVVGTSTNLQIQKQTPLLQKNSHPFFPLLYVWCQQNGGQRLGSLIHQFLLQDIMITETLFETSAATSGTRNKLQEWKELEQVLNFICELDGRLQQMSRHQPKPISVLLSLSQNLSSWFDTFFGNLFTVVDTSTGADVANNVLLDSIIERFSHRMEIVLHDYVLLIAPSNLNKIGILPSLGEYLRPSIVARAKNSLKNLYALLGGKVKQTEQIQKSIRTILLPMFASEGILLDDYVIHLFL